VLCSPLATRAATVWSAGPNDLSFSKAAWDGTAGHAGDPTLSADQDRITALDWLTRGATKALFNAKTETSFNDSVDPVVSPADTQWAFSGLNGNPTFAYGAGAAEHGILTFDYLENSLGGSHIFQSNIMSRAGVLHLIADDIFIDIKFANWQSGSSGPPSGSFAYTRAVAPVPEPAAFAMLVFGAGLLFIHGSASSRIRRAPWRTGRRPCRSR
jgi:hypothetical protein